MKIPFLFVRDGSRVTAVQHVNITVWVRKELLNKKYQYILKGLQLKYGSPGARVYEILENSGPV